MSLFIVTYHYVRPLKKTKYPNLKALDISKFEKQIQFLKKNTTIIKIEDLDSIDFKENKNYSVLTFDDGYLDHYKYVFPILKKNNIQAAFFIPVKNFIDKDILLVNKIHFILEKFFKKENVLEKFINSYLIKENINLNKLKKKWNLKRSKRKVRNFDNKKVFFIKDLLQNILPNKHRIRLVNNLFINFVSKNLKKFHEKLYMSEKHIRDLKNSGMHIGSHGYEHNWYEFMVYNEQKIDIKKSYNILKKRNILSNLKTFCYAYGSHNNNSIKILKNENVKYAFTTVKGSEKNINHNNRLKLKRYDTNDIKKLNLIN